jgi:hypothetical protein
VRIFIDQKCRQVSPESLMRDQLKAHRVFASLDTQVGSVMSEKKLVPSLAALVLRIVMLME